jgi:magnesium chelatase subunit I
MGPKGYGLLVSGERGTAKSTTVRSFAYMMKNSLPVTLPMNATDDRINGGWQVDSLLRGDENPKWDDGLLKEAGTGTETVRMLYIDEVNLLEDHIINQILDVASTGVLTVQRDGKGLSESNVSFMLVGTMNPDEGPLRPQLLDRFGLFVPIKAVRSRELRRDILFTRLKFDNELERRKNTGESAWIREWKEKDDIHRDELEEAKLRVEGIDPEEHPALLDTCAHVAEAFNVVGHRADLVMARAACAAAAIKRRDEPTADDVAGIAQYAVMHRRPNDDYNDGFRWDEPEKARLAQIIAQW